MKRKALIHLWFLFGTYYSVYMGLSYVILYYLAQKITKDVSLVPQLRLHLPLAHWTPFLLTNSRASLLQFYPPPTVSSGFSLYWVFPSSRETHYYFSHPKNTFSSPISFSSHCPISLFAFTTKCSKERCLFTFSSSFSPFSLEPMQQGYYSHHLLTWLLSRS